MDPRHLLVDERLKTGCVYCGGVPETQDHVPSVAFLNEPLPNNLPTVEACTACNQGFSLDEEYFSCFLEVVLSGTTDVNQLTRPTVKRALERNPSLAARLMASRRESDDGQLIWMPELERIQNVVLKLGRGHAAYELTLPQLNEPLLIAALPLMNFTEEARSDFERAGSGELRGWPELGSRAFLRACRAKPFENTDGPWVVVQPGRYRYSVDERGGVIVRLVLAEYLACQVAWE